MSIFEKFFIMMELDTGNFASDIDSIEKKTKNFAQAAKAAAQVDFSQMAKLPTAFDSVLNILDRVDKNLNKIIGQSDSFSSSLNDIKNQVSQVAENTRDVGTSITNNTTITNTLNISLNKTDQTVIAIGKNIKAFGEKIKDATNETGLLKKILGASNHVLKGLGASITDELKGKLSDVFSVSKMVASGFERINEVANLGNMAEQSRIAVGDLDALGRSARDLGGDVSTANNDIKAFADNALEAFSSSGSDAAKAFDELGVSLKDKNGALKDTNTLLLEMADATQGMSDYDVKNKLESLGISDPGMISLIKSGKDGILEQVEAQKKLGVTTSEQVKEANEFQNAQNSLSDIFKVASGELLTLLLPAITAVVEGLKKFTAFCRENKTFATIFFGAIALAVGTYAVAAGAAAIATNAFLWPVLLVIAAVAAFALVINDVINYMNGNDSVIGRLAEKYKGFQKVIDTIKDYFGTFGEVIKEVWAALKSLFNGDFGGFLKHIGNIFMEIGFLWARLWNAMLGVVDGMVATIAKKILDMIPSWALRIVGANADDIKKMRDQIDNNVELRAKAREQELAKAENAERERRAKQQQQRNAEALKYEEDKKSSNEERLENKNTDDAKQEQIKNIETIKTITLAQNTVHETKQTPIPANVIKNVDAKRETNVTVAAPNITINNTTDTAKAANLAAKQVSGMLQQQMSNAIANSDNGISR